MSSERRLVIAGESWVTHSIHQKGFDSFTTTSYHEGVGWLMRALEGSAAIDFLPSHVATERFPTTAAELSQYDVVLLSDIGANTLLLSSATFVASQRAPNRLAALREYVMQGGGLVMIGGYMTFQGIDGRARYGGSPVEEALPVALMASDDRVEAPEGIEPRVAAPDHPMVAGLPEAWPPLLGYNRVIAKAEATVIATVGADPLLVAWEYGQGRSAAFTSDCAPHWCPPEFLEWEHYGTLWRRIVDWVAGEVRTTAVVSENLSVE